MADIWGYCDRCRRWFYCPRAERRERYECPACATPTQVLREGRPERGAREPNALFVTTPPRPRLA